MLTELQSRIVEALCEVSSSSGVIYRDYKFLYDLLEGKFSSAIERSFHLLVNKEVIELDYSIPFYLGDYAIKINPVVYEAWKEGKRRIAENGTVVRKRRKNK